MEVGIRIGTVTAVGQTQLHPQGSAGQVKSVMFSLDSKG